MQGVVRRSAAGGQQPSPSNCDQAERIAALVRNARVIYSDDRNNDRYRDGRDRERNDRNENDRYENDRKENDRDKDDRYENRRNEDRGTASRKGREDVRNNRSFDAVRHSRYRSADRGYNSRYGKDQYKLAYRDAFEVGYAQGYGRRGRQVIFADQQTGDRWRRREPGRRSTHRQVRTNVCRRM